MNDKGGLAWPPCYLSKAEEVFLEGKMGTLAQRGFSLIELVVVVALIGILASIAYPQYTEYMREARRNDATSTMMEIMQNQERFYTENNSYASNLGNLPQYSTSPVVTPKGYYQITAAACSGTSISECVVLSAAPQGAQSGDGTITYNSRGVKQPQTHWD
jgi:type IV pilus assembly protein PilE